MHLTHRLVPIGLLAAVGLFATPRVYAQEHQPATAQSQAAPPADAQEHHVVTQSAMQAAVAAKAHAEEADRTIVLDALRRPEAQRAADQLGLNLTEVTDAVRTMSPADLATLATPARAATSQSGGDVIVISMTTLLLLVIIFLLLTRY